MESYTSPPFSFGKFVFEKWKIILSKPNAKYWKWTNKFGVEVPKSTTQAREFYTKNGTNLWQKYIEKKIKIIQCY